MSPASSTLAEPFLPLEWQVPSGLPAVPPAQRHLRLVTGAELDLSDAETAVPGVTVEPTKTPHDPSAPRLPAPGPWVARLAPAILEVIAGERPAGQLKRWVSRELHETLSRRHAVALRHPAGKARAPQCRRVRSVRICRPAPNVVEASAVVMGASRARAVAVRLEAVKGRWLATAIETS